MARLDDGSDLPAALLGPVRSICLALPEVEEEAAWTGRRWRVRNRTFAHVFQLDVDSPPVLARAGPAIPDELPVTVLAFRAQGPELDALQRSGPPFFAAGWGRGVISLVLGPGTDWDEVAELLTESYCAMAPKKLQALVERPPDPDVEPGGPADA